MIPDNHKVSHTEAQVGAAGCVGNKQVLDTNHLHHADRKRDKCHVISLIVVDTALHGNNGFAAEGANNEAALVADCGGHREARNVPVGDFQRILNLVCQLAKAGAQDYSHGGLKLTDLFADIRCRSVYGFEVSHNDSIILLMSFVILSAARLAAATTSSPSFS